MRRAHGAPWRAQAAVLRSATMAALLLGAAGRSSSPDHTEAILRVRAVNDWLHSNTKSNGTVRNTVPAPSHWAIRQRPAELAGAVSGENNVWVPGLTAVHRGNLKTATTAVLPPSAGRPATIVVVKALNRRKFPSNASDPARHSVPSIWAAGLAGEVIFLEFLRSHPGIPDLLGAWFEPVRTNTPVACTSPPPPTCFPLSRLQDGSFYYVVSHAGEMLGTGYGVAVRPSIRGEGYIRMARACPKGLALALLRCFRSFSEIGGYHMRDFGLRQVRSTPTALAPYA